MLAPGQRYLPLNPVPTSLTVLMLLTWPALLLLAAAAPAPTIECRPPGPVRYGAVLPVVLRNPTPDTLVYYLDLEVRVDRYWTPADPDILVRPVRKERRYRVLPPGARQALPYDTRWLDADYPARHDTYRFTLHYAPKTGAYARTGRLLGDAPYRVSSAAVRIRR
jgi:hypothetical protein